MKHLIERVKLYNAESFPYELHNIELQEIDMSVIYIKTYAQENLLPTLIDETPNTIAITNPLKIDTCMTANRLMTTIYPCPSAN